MLNHFKFQSPIENNSLGAGGVDGNFLAVFEFGGGISRADNAGDAEFAGDDGGMRSAAAFVGHNRGGDFHNRLPVGVGHVRDQHLTLFESADTFDVHNNVSFAGGDLGTNRGAADEFFARL